VNDIPCKPNFDLLLSRDVNSPRLCYVNNEVGSVTPYLTCYGKQTHHFEFLAIWRIRAMFKPNLLLFRTLHHRHFEFTAIWLLYR